MITKEGNLHGWLGGACAAPTVVKEALNCLRDGTPRLLQLGPVGEFGGTRREGVVSVPMACESEGAMEIFLEPEIPVPQLVVVGGSPAAATLAEMAALLGWHGVLVDDGGEAAESGSNPRKLATLDLAGLNLSERDFVVVATQGHYDELALQAALATAAGYVGLVASRKRADAVIEHLRGGGLRDEDLARVHAPAGLDLGSVPHPEIAVSVLAELVALKAKGGLGTGVAVASPVEAIDPVCHMTVAVETARYITEYGGTTYYFCAPGCLKAFESDPGAFSTT